MFAARALYLLRRICTRLRSSASSTAFLVNLFARHNAVFQILDSSKPPGTVEAVLKIDANKSEMV
ncbi:hypothetical protein SAY87_003170 [Trapa incisa]|uniref:Uncharacterized protein n=1 Tax=Trapa incisa TaxID=236973 RepID=A0AAN7KN11_9MYRT|nr:hypothetical protein SAY87_003170 [Trapa incisa]